MAERTVRITTAATTLGEVVDLAEGALVELGDDAVGLIAESRRTVDEAIARGEAIYGVTTSVGHARDERLEPAALRALQPVLLEMHVGALGSPLVAARVRAGMAVRLCGFARGGAGVSLAVALGVADLLNHRIHPVIPSRGSVGSGDLGQLALVGRVLLGRGQVEVDGRRLDAGAALASAGLEPLTLEPKDALALISSNALSIGHGALLVPRVRELIALADLVAAVSMEAIHANPSIIDPAVALVRGSAGQRRSSERIGRALAGSMRSSSSAALSVQDPLSFRVVPQVHGACSDVLAVTESALTAELNATSDNPLVDVATGRIISNGNFAPMNVTLAAESLRVALGHVGLLSERRMGHLWDAAVTSLGTSVLSTAAPTLAAGAPTALAGLGLRYPAAARYTRLRRLAEPVSLDVPTLDLNVEDHSSNLAEALVATEEAIGVVEELLVTELLIATVLLGSPTSSGSLGRGTERLVAAVSEELDAVPPAALPDEVHRRVAAGLRRRGPHRVDLQDHPAGSAASTG
jgi:histidine ammonia-lyase